jgi:hypothetical protein
MEGMRNEDTSLEKLNRAANKLAVSAESLSAQFRRETVRLKRKDEVARLTALRSATLQEVESVRDMEMAAESGYRKAMAGLSLFRLFGGLITATSEHKTMRAISRRLLTDYGDREPPFGTILIRIGPRGIPEDIEVVSVSSLARESKRDESEIMNGLLVPGNLLVSRETFSP